LYIKHGLKKFSTHWSRHREISFDYYLQNAGEEVGIEVWPVYPADVHHQLDQFIPDVGGHSAVVFQ
jgi:hypothetical protein